MTKSPKSPVVTLPAQHAPGPVPDGGTLSKANQHKREQLLDGIRAHPSRLVVVTGTGVTLQSVGNAAVAGWPGLLADGLERCRRLKLIDDDDADIVALQIEKRKCEHFIQAAQKIHECLDKRANERHWWMEESVGSLKVKDSRLIDAILALNGLVTTLNYDNTIQQVSGRQPLHWKQQKEITKRIIDHATDFTLHLHGHREDLDSIVLDRTSYDAICMDVQMRDLLRRFARFETLLFIGCRQTFLDPNFQTLLEWAQIGLLGLESRHFVLCRAREEIDLVSEIQPHGYLTPLVYGDDYADMAPFLEKLAIEARGAATANPPTLPQAPAAAHVLKPVDIWNLQTRR